MLFKDVFKSSIISDIPNRPLAISSVGMDDADFRAADNINIATENDISKAETLNRLPSKPILFRAAKAIVNSRNNPAIPAK